MIFVQLNQDGLESTGKRSILHCGREDFRDVFREDFREDFKSQLNRVVCVKFYLAHKWAAPRHGRATHKRVVPQKIADGDNTIMLYARRPPFSLARVRMSVL